MPPGWRPEGLPPNPRRRRSRAQTAIPYDTEIPRALNAYALGAVRGDASGGIRAAGGRQSLPRGALVVAAVLVLWALLNIGGIFERRRWVLYSELLRLPVTGGLAAGTMPAPHGAPPRRRACSS